MMMTWSARGLPRTFVNDRMFVPLPCLSVCLSVHFQVVNAHRYQLYISGPTRVSAVDNLLCIHCPESKVSKGT